MSSAGGESSSSQKRKADAKSNSPLSPQIYTEEPPQSFEYAFQNSSGRQRSDDVGEKQEGRDAKSDSDRVADILKNAHGHEMETGMIAAAAASRYSKNNPQERQGEKTNTKGREPPSDESGGEVDEKGSSVQSHRSADGIGGSGLGTAATGDLGATQEFPTLLEIQNQVEDLEQDYAARHPDRTLSGRIIHVSHFIPFVIRALAEVDFEKKREEKVTATANVAAMAAAARARKAAKLAAEGGAKKDSDKTPAPGSFRKGSFLEGMSETTDLEKRLAENQARSRAKAGRRAWMMTPMATNNEVAVEDEDEVDSVRDTFTPIGSRRGSSWSEASGRHLSFSNVEGDNKYSAVSDENSPMRTPMKKLGQSPPEVVPPLQPPQWVLAPRRGHTALNSGIRSLCATHAQTFIGWPGDIHFAAQARGDERKDATQTTREEQIQIEGVLASLDDPKNWASQEAPVKGSGGAGQEETISKVPTPLMNGADPVESGKTDATSRTKHGIKYVPVWLEHNVAHGHYDGYCKTTLWPLFHYLLWQDVPGDRKNWEDFSWDAYVAANEAYARRIAEQHRPGDLVWIHDYHLLLVPQMLRKLVPDAHIGLFIHAPFPSSEVFRCLPQRREIIEGMLGADLACFQAFSYSRHFLSSCIRVCGFEASSNSVESFNGHITNVAYNPIGIDAEKIAKDCADNGVGPKIEAIRNMYKGKKIIIGRDKLDVVRGVIQKLQAFYKLLEEFPQWRDKVVLIQVTAPSMNDSPLLERQVSELVSHINGEFGNLSFTPVHHYHQIIDRDEYYALLSVADLAIVSSLRDGMTASTMEYIVAQEKYKKSPLLLSEFTGSAGRLRSAIQINPWATFSCAKAINYALMMSDEERLQRHDDLYHQVISHTSHTWAATLVKLLVQQLLSEQTAHFTPPLNRTHLVEQHHHATKRLFLLDYDGTLTPIVKDPEAALPSKKLLSALERLSQDDRNLIYIISGRDERFLNQHLGHLQQVGFSAEHGGYMKEVGSDKWINLTKDLDMTWMKSVKGAFEYYTERTSGSVIEEKKSSITWHYRNADPDFGIFQAKECQAHLENMVAQLGMAIEVLVGKKNLECRPLAVNKGEIVKRILYNNPDAEFVFCAGDDKTDEDMFRALCLLDTQASAGGSNGGCHESPKMDSNTDAEPSTVTTTSASPKAVKKGLQEQANAPNTGLIMSPPAPLNNLTSLGSPRPLALKPSGIFTTTIGPSGKKTLAKWHVDSPQKIIDALAEMAELERVGDNAPSNEALEKGEE
ncbi:hypothetical protein CBS101457_001953 [Exobasidium rhododendri]|nr:hypothetical protein CBS101457_001953 [Exobasidium rhododendri]